MRLVNKTALVTGAGRGIGRAISLKLAEEGAKIIVNYANDQAAAASLVDEIASAGGSAVAVRADLSKLDHIDRMFHEIAGHATAIDILVNNAGRGTGGLPTLDSLTPEDYDYMFDLNARGLFFVTQRAVRLMPDGGRIINISSSSSQTRQPGLSAYAGSKAATEAFTRIWSTELAKRKITVNAILPGIVETDLIQQNLGPELAKKYGNAVPLGRLGQPDDIADVVAFLGSGEARWITGECIKVSGGA